VHEIIRFGVVGGLNTLTDVAVFLSLAALRPPGHDAAVGAEEALAAWLAGTTVGRRLHAQVTFHRTLPVGGYYAVAAVSAAVQMGVAAGATAWMGNRGAVAGKIVGLALAGIFSYLGYRWLVRERTPGRRVSAPTPRGVASAR
jgi:putative flippase GtrA